MAGTYAHAKLIQILGSAVESNHPVTRPISQKNGFYGVEYSKIIATEEQLEEWFASMPPSFVESSTVGTALQMRSQLLLRLAYAHVQMVLYRPFLHHALKIMRSNSPVISLKAYACGSACIKAAMQVVWLAETLESYNLFNEAHWFAALIISFTAACLVLFVMSNEGDPTLKETEDAVRRIKGLCQRHSGQNPSMARCYRFLESVYPSEPTPRGERQDPFNAWSREVSNTFSEAYRLSDDAGLETQQLQGEDLLQALSLPQLRSFVNNRI
ncbi:Gypsy retrotransposon integrase-like protein 1 [Vermiconidia calcicola]|uniref:Gypsy retrotransposon integrase-like protein 1 n=1 Tax=Vermiconidia calcicola TaxID=1690605 RepID=A0ACC3NCZ6_9PEZI|nr:Gypsy retrotransposon integrase-like protein 1 [Vermiconidia calcicola]